MSKRIVMIAVLVFTAFAALAQNKTEPMLSIEFRGEDGQEMNMTVPVNMLEQFAPQIQQALRDLTIDDKEINLFEIWESIRDAGPNEFLEVNSDDADIKVSTTETHLRVDVNEKNEGKNLEVMVPLALGDALFANATFDYQTALDALLSVEGDLVRVRSADDSIFVRVYIN